MYTRNDKWLILGAEEYGTVVKHDCFIGDGCHIDCNATVKSGIVLRAHTKVDCGSVIRVSLLDEVNKNVPEQYYFEAGF